MNRRVMLRIFLHRADTRRPRFGAEVVRLKKGYCGFGAVIESSFNGAFHCV